MHFMEKCMQFFQNCHFHHGKKTWFRSCRKVASNKTTWNMIKKVLPYERESNFTFIPQGRDFLDHLISSHRGANFLAKKFVDRIQNFAKKVEPLCEEMRWSRNSRPWGINVKFDSLSYGKTYMIIFQVVLRKKFYCCYFF